jgi:O-antigen/teichoic acid export membrane protein
MEENNIQIAEEVYDSQSGKGFKKIFKNFSLLTFGKISGDFFTLILFVVLSREFGKEGIGEYSFAVGLTGLFAVCADFGLYSYTVKEISKDKNAFINHFNRIISLRTIQSAAVFFVLLIVVVFLKFPAESKMIIVLIGIYQIVYSSIDGISAVFIAHEYMHISAVMDASFKIVSSLTAILIALLGGRIVVSLTALPVIAIIMFFAARIVLRKKIGKSKLIFSYDALKETFKHAVPYGTSDFLWQLYARIDVVLIGFILGESAAGIYNVGYRVVFFLFFFARFASVALFPIVSRLYHESKFEFQKMYDKSLSMIIIICLPVSAGLWLIAPKLIELVFGSAFSESAAILRILSGLFIATCVSSIMEVFLMSSDRQVRRAKRQWTATWITIILNAVLIYLYGIEGAAVAVLTCSILLVVFYLFEMKEVIGFPEVMSRLLISLLGVLAFCVPLSFLNHLSIFLMVPAAVFIYLAVILIFKDVRRNELRMFLSLISTPK